MADKIMNELCSSLKLERDRGYQDLMKYLESISEENVDTLESDALKLLSNSDATWETKHGGLTIAKALLIDGTCSDDFVVDMRDEALELLDDGEFRVRIAAGN